MTTDNAKKLIFVSSDNNNKYYDMLPNGNDSWTAKWGRVGVTESTQVYPMSKWDSKYKEKLKKGYRDVTHLHVVSTAKTASFMDIKDTYVSKLIRDLQSYAKKSVSENYTVSSEAVTQAQVDEAQAVLNTLSGLVKLNGDVYKINDNLLELFQIIPRKMKNVKHHIYEFDKIRTRDQLTLIQEAISNEQATLDVMSGQVQLQSSENAIEDKGAVTLLDAMGIQVVSETDMIPTIKNMMGGDAHKFRRAFAVKNIRTQKSFDTHVASRSNKTVKLFWHGSRNENWLSIMEQGLVLRPTNAIRTGSMYGQGIYFADKAGKSLGYTSIRGSYWSNGNSNVAYLALYDVHLGNTLRVPNHGSWCYDLSEPKLKAKGDYDSVFAEKGADLRNNEYIVYNNNKSTVKYLIEVSA